MMLLVSYEVRIFALIDMLKCGLYQIVLLQRFPMFSYVCFLDPYCQHLAASTATVISRTKGSTFHSGPVGIRSSWVLSIWDGYMGDGREMTRDLKMALFCKCYHFTRLK